MCSSPWNSSTTPSCLSCGHQQGSCDFVESHQVADYSPQIKQPSQWLNPPQASLLEMTRHPSSHTFPASGHTKTPEASPTPSFSPGTKSEVTPVNAYSGSTGQHPLTLHPSTGSYPHSASQVEPEEIKQPRTEIPSIKTTITKEETLVWSCVCSRARRPPSIISAN